jgi:hypothetical protein
MSSPTPDGENLLPPGGAKLNPRRRPAHLSVSLRHALNPISDAMDVECDNLRVPEITYKSRSGGTSSGMSNRSGNSSNINVNSWFNHSNKSPQNVFLDDNESPYFLPNPSSNGSSNKTQKTPPRATYGPQPHYMSAPRLLQMARNRSSSDEYRSVIDDLTIENKKLKEKLRKYQKLDSAHLEKDKLFAIKIHSLSARKREEFVDTIRDFVSNLDDASKDSPAQGLHGQSPLLPEDSSSSKHKSSSNTSLPRNEDSAYASMSTSGPTSSSATNKANGELKQISRSCTTTKNQNVQSYLHDIPEGIAPKHPIPLTERQRKKLVVKRLEQLFTGKAGLNGGNAQPLQQQEVSNSAARADEAAMNGIVPTEGTREAQIQPYVGGNGETLSKLPLGLSKDVLDISDDSSPEHVSPEQRPTRPLDLDPDRAQIPAENVEYIRHLGISTPQLINEDSADAASDADGWVYLNLLINMAQLHMINVTPDFVRAAVSEVSEKFQLSRDGKQVRWRGGTRGTRFSSDSGPSSAQNRSPNDSDSLDERARKRRKLETGKPATNSPHKCSSINVEGKLHPFQYKPMFYHQSTSSDNLESTDESDSLHGYQEKTASDMRHSTSIYQDQSSSGSKRAKRSDDGVIVFFSGATFYTDLSGDREGPPTPLHITGVGKDGYSDHTYDALGCPPRKVPLAMSRTASGSNMPFRPFKTHLEATARALEDASFANSEPLTDDVDGLFVEDIPSGPTHTFLPLDLNACGLGGTRPLDHFLVQVETRRTKNSKPQAKNLRPKKFSRAIPKSSLESFSCQDPKSVEENISHRLAALTTFPVSPKPVQVTIDDCPIHIEVMSAHYKSLAPSELPPGVGYYDPSEESEDSSGAESSTNYFGVSHLRDAKIKLQRSISSSNNKEPGSPPSGNGFIEDSPIGFRTDIDSDVEDNIMDDDSDESIDLLAHARQFNPEFIKAKEEEFEMEIDCVEKETTRALVNSYVATVDEDGFCTNKADEVDVNAI